MGAAISSTVAAGADRLAGSMLPKSFVLIMIGLDDAGKTSLVNRLKRRDLPAGMLPATITTIASTTETISYGRHSVTVQEIGGSNKIRPLWRCYFWHAHGFVFTLDAAAPARFPEAKEELQRMWEEIGDMHPALVLANKVDLPGAVELGEIEEALGVAALAGSGRRIALKGISAMSGEGIDEALEWFVENISHHLIADTNENKKYVLQAK
ncbi:ADP-ribosylation factor family-domain-containing protein [Mycena capillaripes]|nr:ADP-ribosylation factor family-domain-containing protein [Mycena capillaripes]